MVEHVSVLHEIYNWDTEEVEREEVHSSTILTPNVDFASWDSRGGVSADSWQVSSMNESGFSLTSELVADGIGSPYGFGTYGGGMDTEEYTSSIFDIAFSLDVDTEVSLIGNIFTAYESDGDFLIELFEGSDRVFANRLHRNDFSVMCGSDDPASCAERNQAINLDFLLGPGEYRLWISSQVKSICNMSQCGGEALGSINLDGNFSYNVPVPAAGWLFGSAALGLIGVRLKRSQKQVCADV